MDEGTAALGDEVSVGWQIRRLRSATHMTQVELAAAAGVSLDLIRKLEQEVRYTASVASLHKIARALDVDTGELLAKATPLPQPTEHSGVVAMRRVLTGVDDLLHEQGEHIDDRVSVADTRRAVTYAWGTYWAGRYEQLGEILPNAMLGARATHRDNPGLADLASQLYQVAGCTLVHLGHPDAAHLAMREALTLARAGVEPLRVAALYGSLSWLLLTQGRFDEAHRLAVDAAKSITPDNQTELPRMSLWGSLVLGAATAAGRDGRADAAGGLLNEARQVARHTGHRNDYECAFGPDQVTMQTVDVQVVTENYTAALKTATAIPRTSPLPLAARARHLADRALAHTRLGHDDTALDVLIAMEQAAPMWSRYQTQPKMIVRELRGRERGVRNPRLRDLARRLGVDGQGDSRR